MSTVTPNMVVDFWGAVRDCLVQFHGCSPSEASLLVGTLWRSLFGLEVPPKSLDNIIYHTEPWYIACQMRRVDLPLEEFRSDYNQVLRRNHLLGQGEAHALFAF